MSAFTRTRRIGWKAIVGIALVPLTIAGLFIWGLWSPTDRLRTVEAAVVNLDQPVTIDGQVTPLGRVFAGALIGDSSVSDDETNFTWQLTNEQDAEEGLAEGRYATVVTIPENFSEAATSGGDPATAEQATIDIATSDLGRLIDSALSNVVTSTATRVLNEQLGTAFIDQVFVGMGTLHTSLGEAADGASALADGSRQLADGATGLSTGAGALASGASELSTAAGTLAGGVSELAAGLNEYAAGARDLAGGARLAADGTAQYTGGVSLFSGELSAQVQSLNTAVALAGDCVASGASAEFCEQYQVIVDTMPELNVSAYSLGAVATKGPELAGGSKRLADGLDLFAASGEQIAAGAGQLAGGASQILAIPPKHAIRPVIEFLTPEEIDALLAAPDRKTWTWRRDHALLALAVQTGFRISEICALTLNDIHLGVGPHATCTGKGRRQRTTPLTRITVNIMKTYLAERSARPGIAVFCGPHGQVLSRDALEHRLTKHLGTARNACPSLANKHVTMHTLRHTTAMNLLTAGVDVAVIALWLGHANTHSTDAYLHADLTIKQAAIDRTRPPGTTPGSYHPEPDILAWLNAL